MSVKEFEIDHLKVSVHKERAQMAKAAADFVANRIRQVATEKGGVRMIFAAAVSQLEFFTELLKQEDIPWDKIIAFHMDEYHTLPEDAPQRFGNFLRKNLFRHKPFGEVYFLGNDAKGYAKNIEAFPIDIVCLGIGENGHLAFNDPPVANFSENKVIKEVVLDPVCRQQQVNDGAFETISEVPETAVTLTIPALMKADFLSVVVPGKSKADAVEKTLFGSVSTDCPATALRLHPKAKLFLDNLSSIKIMENML